jgi:hypothetical protein
MPENSNKIFNTAVGFSLVGILIITILIFQQLSTANDLNKVNLTYKIYSDMTDWEHSHPETRKWIYEYDDKKDSMISLDLNYYKWQFDDYLTYFETIYELQQKDLVDKELAYNLFSGNLEQIYEVNNFELQRILKQSRIDQNDPEVYIGAEKLYYEFMKRRKTISGEHKTSPTQK